MVMQTHLSHHKVTGVLIAPENLEEGSDGQLRDIKPSLEKKPIRSRKLRKGSLELLIGDKTDYDVIPMMLSDPNHAQLQWAKGYVPPWNFQRVPDRPSLLPELPIVKP